MIPHRRLGVTLVELVVVVVILALFIAITLPAVQHAREAARRQTCSNHLKQLGVALHSYQSLYGVFPSGMMSDRELTAGGGAYSPLCRILPFLDERQLFNSINFSISMNVHSYEAIENITAIRSRPEAFLCPSDPHCRVGAYGGTCYRVNMGSEFEIVRKPLGAFVIFDWLRPENFLDGLAHTVAVGEKLRGDDQQSAFYPLGDARYITVYAIQDREELLQLCLASTSTDPHFSQGGYSWMLAGNRNSWYNHITTPNHPMGDCAHGGPGTADPRGVFSASSYHGGGVNTLLMDGSVRFFGDNVELNVWRALSTRAANDQAL